MLCRKLLELIENTGYSIIQHNGQRKFGPHKNWTGPPPPKGSEVFIGKLPRDVFENELVPLFSKVGRIYTLRLMLNFSGSSRGFAFLTYCSRSEASAAIRELHNYEIRPGHYIAVVRSVDNCRLYLGGIPKNKGREDILKELAKHVTGIVDVLVYTNCFDRRYNRGFAFVEFGTHREAAMARRALTPGPVRLWDHDVMVDWAEPEPEVDDEVLRKVKVLFVRNLCINTTQEKLRELVEKIVGEPLERIKKIYDYAFVHFYSRKKAEIAMKHLNNFELDGLKLEIKWAKPVDRKLYKIQKLVKGNSKFNSTTSAFQKALALYEKQIIENEFGNSSPDEGIASAATSISYSGTPKKVPQQNPVQMFPEDPLANLESLCKSFNWSPPFYECQKHLEPDGAHSWICKVEFGFTGPTAGFPCWKVLSVPCLTVEEAEYNAAYTAVSVLKMYQQHEAYSSPYAAHLYPQPIPHSQMIHPMAMASPEAIVPWHPGVYTNTTVPAQMW